MTSTPETSVRENWEVRFEHELDTYNKGHRKICWRMWHPDIYYGPRCQYPIKHEGDHRGGHMMWSRTPRVSELVAQRFLEAHGSICSGAHRMTLLDNGIVSMSVNSLAAAAGCNHAHDGY